MGRFKLVVRVAAVVHVVVGVALIVGILLASPWRLGVGHVDAMVHTVERVDWRGWILAAMVLGWTVPLVVGLLAWRVWEVGTQAAQLRATIEKLLAGRQVPIAVHVDACIPVQIPEPLRVSVALDTTVPLDDVVDVEADIPLRIALPVDAEVGTKVMGLGFLKVPIHAVIPIDLVVPVRGKARVRSPGLPVKVREEVTVTLPSFEVPLRARLDTRVDVLESLRATEDQLRGGLRAREG